MPGKQVEITEDVVADIEAAAGTEVDPDEIVVFEADALSTSPIEKHGSLFHGGVVSRDTLVEMSDRLGNQDVSVPLHTMHQQGEELPIGKVFRARVEDRTDGQSVLRAMFYLSKSSERALIEKINLGVLDEVSVGLKTSRALCSKCGFDYYGAEADFVHLFSQTCDNDHTIGVEGTHLKLSGLDNWMELSLVSRGASSKPKILNRARRNIPQEERDRMAADGKPVEALLLTTTTKMETPMPKGSDTNTDPQGPEQNQELTTVLSGIADALTELSSKVDALQAPAEPEPDPAPEPEPNADLTALRQEIADLKASLTKEEDPDIEPEVTLPTKGTSASAVSNARKPGKDRRAAAFSTKSK